MSRIGSYVYIGCQSVTAHAGNHLYSYTNAAADEGTANQLIGCLLIMMMFKCLPMSWSVNVAEKGLEFLYKLLISLDILCLQRTIFASCSIYYLFYNTWQPGS